MEKRDMMMGEFRFVILILCVYLCSIRFIHGQNVLSRRAITSTLLDPSKYDSNIVPDFDEEYPTNVTIQITIHDMHSISETTMEYSVDVYLRMWWRDERLDFSGLSNISKLELDSKSLGNVWQPDIFFENEKRATVHSVTTTNKLVHILRNGTVVYSIRLSLALSCTMLLQYYPFDSQRCPLIIQSFGYTQDNINLDWYKISPVSAENLEMPQFELAEDDITTSDYSSPYSQTGTFSTLKAELHLTRKVGFYFLQVFVPAVLLVVLSWVSFWVDPNAVPARVSLGVTCVLTMTTQSAGIRQSLPPVSYVKAIDVWMFVCLLFVFAALLEFAYVNVLLRRKAPVSHEAYELRKTDGEDTKNEKDEVKGRGAKILEFIRSPAPDAKTKAKRVDIVSRFLFPISFILFLIIFFMVCGLAKHPPPDDD
ncbi:glycine receptor subunit alpha-3-like [Ruditapes philippinarum]|uniref:glycine receptor subunit alpha-3-like n=1 Tax=Ruditapes philippinarum TaxID=129788 RepID=UPI00295A59E5|nr:glycine receptor subunit alpha-3-like [Ruditapes philippinarum]XP_060591319.1 glycine receptor subunit alpha-3-like [Ruditapes philippinarum]XP_060591320.1 glycine receptor subunit alpha-3-like [Ruditapes philippinarum]XP_060591321.1 glycine receptor subunit alpha-3-like [Ruditapes philippinarum]